MRIPRRALAALALPPGAAAAQGAGDWPRRPVRFVIPFPPGGPTDILGRVVTNRLAVRLGQPMVIENRGGASGMIGAGELARAAPDGHSFMIHASLHVIAPQLGNAAFDPLRDFVPVTNIAAVPLVLAVNPRLPVHSVAELVAWLKAQDGRASFASSGNAAATHLAGELFKLTTGTRMEHIPYRGSAPAVQDVVAGNVPVIFDSLPSSAAALREGLMRPLAMTTARRVPAFPQVPTMEEAGVPGFAVSTWYGIWGPARTPGAAVLALQQAVAAVLEEAKVRDRLAALGAEPVGDTPEAFAAFVAAEHERWGRVLRAANVRAE